jgi:hypothetical protein
MVFQNPFSKNSAHPYLFLKRWALSLLPTWGGSGIDIDMAKSLTHAVKEDIPYPFGQILLDPQGKIT